MAEIIASQQSDVLQIYNVFSKLISLENAESNWSKVFAESGFYLKQTIPQLFPNQLNNLKALLLQDEKTIARRNRFEIVQREIRFAEKHIAQQIDSQVNILEVNERIYDSREQTKAWNFLKESKELENEAEETIERIDEQCEEMEELCGAIEKLKIKYEDEKTSNNERKNLYQKIRTKYNFLDSIYTDTKDELNEIKIRIDSHLVKLASNTEAQKTALSKSLYMEQAIKDKSTNVASEEESKSAEEIAEMHKKDAQQSVKLIEANDAQVVKFVQIMQEIEKREKKLEEFRKIRDETKVFLEKFKDDAIMEEYLQIAKQIYQDEDFKNKIKILCKSPDQFDNQLDQWHESVQEFIEQNCLVQIDRLQVIVLGTHGWLEFNKDTALVANEEFEGNFRDLPVSVKLFIRYLDLINQSHGLYTSKESDYDYGAYFAKKQGYLFLNTCLSTNAKDMISCLCSNEFVKRILDESKKNDTKRTKPIAILNFQMNYREIVEKIAHFETYESCVQLGDPRYWNNDIEDFDESDCENKELSTLKSLIEKGYEINHIYLTKKFLDSKSIRKAQDPDNDQAPKDNDNNLSKDIERKESNEKNDGSPDKSSEKQKSPTKDESNDKVSNKTEEKLEKRQDKIQPVEALRILLTLTANKGWNVYKLNKEQLEPFCQEFPNMYDTQSEFADSNLYQKVDNQKQCFALLSEKYDSENVKANIANVLIFDKSKNSDSSFFFDFFGITINYDKKRCCYVLNQIATIDQLIKDYETLNKDEIKEKLFDLAAKTRPDLAATVNIPDQLSDYASQDLIYYLKKFKQFKLMLAPVKCLAGYSDGSDKNENSRVSGNECLNDSDLISDLKLIEKSKEVLRTQIGYLIVLCQCSVAWYSAHEAIPNDLPKTDSEDKSKIVTNTYLEFSSKIKVLQKIAQVREMLDFVGVSDKDFLPFTVFVDSEGDIQAFRNICKNETANANKLYDLHIQFRDLLFDKQTGKEIAQIQFKSSRNNLADIFTKPLHCKLQNKKEVKANKTILNSLGLKDVKVVQVKSTCGLRSYDHR